MEIKTPDLPNYLVENFPPNMIELLKLIRPEVDDEMLLNIADADYGNGLEENLNILRRIVDKIEFVSPLKWNPREVLTLCRWAETGPNTSRRNIIQRVFCCYCLLCDSGDPKICPGTGWEDSIVRLLENALVLGPDFSEALARFIVWRLPLVDPDYSRNRPFLAVALFILAVLTRKIAEQDIPMLIDWLNEEVEFERDIMQITEKNDRQLDMEWCPQSKHIWKRTAARLGTESVWIQSIDIREKVIDIAKRLAI